MPKFTMEDVDRDIEERRAKYRQPKPLQDGRGLLDKLLNRVRQPRIKPPKPPRV